MAFFKFICIKYFLAVWRLSRSVTGLSPLWRSFKFRGSPCGICGGLRTRLFSWRLRFSLSVGCHPTDSTNHDTCDV